jgi:signal transduction histidine kinase
MDSMKAKNPATSFRMFNRIIIWVVALGIVSVILCILAVNISDRLIIDKAAGRYRHDEFLRTAGAVSRVITDVGELNNVPAIRRTVEDILEVRPSLRWVDVFELAAPHAQLVYSSRGHSPTIDDLEVQELLKGRSVAHLDESEAERAWVILAPLRLQGTIVGGMRGRFSISKYDQLILSQGQYALAIGIVAIISITAAFLLVIRAQVHQPLAHFIRGIDLIRSGNLEARVPVTGPQELQQLAARFNDMLTTVAGVVQDKESLLMQLHGLNATLQERVEQAVSRLEKANKELLAAQDELKKSEKLAMLGELSAIMAHELGNPLNAISGRLQMAASAQDPAAATRHLDIVRTEVGRMAQVMRHILTSTRPDAKPGEHDVNAMIRDFIGLQLWTHIDVELALQDDLPAVYGNGTVIRSIILNLCVNAVQAMPLGGRLRVATRYPGFEQPASHVLVEDAAYPRSRFVSLQIEDNGRGIPAGLLPMIGTPFVTTRQGEGGVGLGLAICRRGLLEMGGGLSVQSIPGRGTTFIIDLPTARDHDQHVGSGGLP